ncbi:MAG: hypothetical protein V2A53_04710 [bacterium]
MKLLEGSINATRAIELLELSYVHTLRLKKKVKNVNLEQDEILDRESFKRVRD